MENNFKSWIQSPISKLSIAIACTFVLITIILLPGAYESYFGKDYVSLAGKNYSSNDVKKTNPGAYARYRKEIATLTKNLLGEFAQEKLFELASKDAGLPVDDILKQGFSPRVPKEEELLAIYELYKGQLNGQSFAQARLQILGLVQSQEEQEYQRGKYRELLQKYPIEFKIKEPEVVRVSISGKNNPSIGNETAKITVIEFSDFECPFCQRSQEVNQRLREKYKDQIRWVFRDFPLPFHENAKYAHIAANCALTQNKYWDLFPLLFQYTGKLSKAKVDELAVQAGVNKKQFQECTENPSAIQKEIDADIEEGQKNGVSGTPAFFINGIFVSGAMPFEHFDEIIQKELKN